MTDFTIILRSLTARMFSTVTTVITVAVAVALILVLLSMQDAGRQAFSRGSGNAHLVVTGDSDPLSVVLNGLFYAYPPSRPIAWATYQKLAGSYPLEFAIPTQQGDSYQGFPVLATEPAFFEQFRPDEREPWRIASGRFFSKQFEVVLGAACARTTGLQIGDTIHLTHGIARSRQSDTAGAMAPAADPHVHNEFAYEVVGVLVPTGSAHDRALFTSLDSTWIVHAHERREREAGGEVTTTLGDLTDEDRKITGAYLRVATRPGQDASAAIPVVAAALRQETAFTVAQPTKQIERLFAMVSSINQIFVAIACVVMVSSGVGIMLALYNSMEQRRRQIAVLRVLGASAGRIFSLVLTESTVLGLLGAASGIGLAWIGAAVVAAVLKQRLGLVIEPSVGPIWILLVAAATVVVSAVAGVVPAAMAYRTPVVKNLKPLG